MPGKIPNEERLTEDEIARRKLGPRGVPGGEDSAKMTPQQERTCRRKVNSTVTLRRHRCAPGKGPLSCKSASLSASPF